MLQIDSVEIEIPGKGTYENFIDECGTENESLNGAGLRDGCYCKHYRWARDWSDKENVDRNGIPLFRHYCAKSQTFGGWAYCCGAYADCYEKGKSAGVKRLLNRIRKQRLFGGGRP